MIPRTVDAYIVCKHFTTAAFLVNDPNSTARLVRTGPVRKVPSTKGPHEWSHVRKVSVRTGQGVNIPGTPSTTNIMKNENIEPADG